MTSTTWPVFKPRSFRTPLGMTTGYLVDTTARDMRTSGPDYPTFSRSIANSSYATDVGGRAVTGRGPPFAAGPRSGGRPAGRRSWVPMSYTAVILEWFRTPAALASCSKRRSRSGHQSQPPGRCGQPAIQRPERRAGQRGGDEKMDVHPADAAAN